MTDSEPYFAIADNEGRVDHMSLRMDRDDCISEFIDTEQAMHALYNVARTEKGIAPVCCPSWEGWEAKGWKVVTVRIVLCDPGQ